MISLIVAHDRNLVIGKDNMMPWHHSEDLKYFKKTTLGKNVLMGSNTLQSIIDYLGKPLPNRQTYLLTSRDQVDYDVVILNSIDEVLKSFENKDLFVAGGKSVYEQMLPFADRLYITYIDETYEGDTFFS
jgi:dihydrofolate reductase